MFDFAAAVVVAGEHSEDRRSLALDSSLMLELYGAMNTCSRTSFGRLADFVSVGDVGDYSCRLRDRH